MPLLEILAPTSVMSTTLCMKSTLMVRLTLTKTPAVADSKKLHLTPQVLLALSSQLSFRTFQEVNLFLAAPWHSLQATKQLLELAASLPETKTLTNLSLSPRRWCMSTKRKLIHGLLLNNLPFLNKFMERKKRKLMINTTVTITIKKSNLK